MPTNRSFRTICIAAGLSVTTIAPAMGQTTLIFGEPGPKRGAGAEATQWFADRVSQLTKGDLTLDIKRAGVLFSQKAAVQSLCDGVAALGSVFAVYIPQEMITDGIADVPPENPDAWVGMKASDAPMRNNGQIRANLAAQNLVYVCTDTTSAVQLGCKEPAVDTVGDLQGRKVRGVGANGQTFRDLGATDFDMTVCEACQGLEGGLIACTQTPYLVRGLKFDEVSDSDTFIDWGRIAGLGILMNMSMFDGPTQDQQQAIMTAGEGLSDEFGRMIGAANIASIQILDDQGKEIVTLPEEERAKLIQAGQKYVDGSVERANASGLDGQAILDDYRGLIRQNDVELAEKGYHWDRG